MLVYFIFVSLYKLFIEPTGCIRHRSSGAGVGLDPICATTLTGDYQNFKKSIIADVGLVSSVLSAIKTYSLPVFFSPQSNFTQRNGQI